MGKAQGRVSRLLEIVAVLEGGSGWRSAALSERFGVSRTQIFNDVRALREAGVPVERSPSGYRIAPSFFLPSVRLTPREVFSLLFPIELFAQGQDERSVHRAARDKLIACLPEPVRPGARELVRRTSVVLPSAAADAEVFAAVREALVARQRVVLVYSGRRNVKPHPVELDPYGLAYRKHAWYVVGHSATHGAVRKFRLSRVLSVEPTPLRFTLPEDFSVDDCFGGAWYVFGGEPREICRRFGPRAARHGRGRRAHPGQHIQTFSDGSILYRAVVTSLDEVAWWLIQYGGDAYVESPAELRDKVIELAHSTLERYGVAPRAGVGPRPYAAGPAPAPARDMGRVAEQAERFGRRTGDSEPPPARP